MNYKEITELLKLISDSHLSEFRIKDGDFELSIKTDKYHQKSPDGQQYVQVPIPAGAAGPDTPAAAVEGGAPAESAAAPAANGEGQKAQVEIKAPMGGAVERGRAAGALAGVTPGGG